MRGGQPWAADKKSHENQPFLEPDESWLPTLEALPAVGGFLLHLIRAATFSSVIDRTCISSNGRYQTGIIQNM